MDIASRQVVYGDKISNPRNAEIIIMATKRISATRNRATWACRKLRLVENLKKNLEIGDVRGYLWHKGCVLRKQIILVGNSEVFALGFAQ